MMSRYYLKAVSGVVILEVMILGFGCLFSSLWRGLYKVSKGSFLMKLKGFYWR